MSSSSTQRDWNERPELPKSPVPETTVSASSWTIFHAKSSSSVPVDNSTITNPPESHSTPSTSAGSIFFSYSPSMFSWWSRPWFSRDTSSQHHDLLMTATSAGAKSPSFSSPWYYPSINFGAESTYKTLTEMVSSLYTYKGDKAADSVGVSDASWTSNDSPSGVMGRTSSAPSSLIMTLQRQRGRRQRKRGPIVSRMGSLDSMLASTLLENPYQAVRGHNYLHNNAMTAIRSFIDFVPNVQDDIHLEDDKGEDDPTFGVGAEALEKSHLDSALLQDFSSPLPDPKTVPERLHQSSDLDGSADEEIQGKLVREQPARLIGLTNDADMDARAESSSTLDGSLSDLNHSQMRHRADVAAERAAYLAEGTIRAWRDMALEEAVALNAALRFWSVRWEQPGLSFLEAGPQVWMSKHGYSHLSVGERVAQIQAVLARRCAAIGELQQHLLQAGWQKGVAQWAVLGQGGQWASVAGFGGSIQPDARNPHPHQQEEQTVNFSRHSTPIPLTRVTSAQAEAMSAYPAISDLAQADPHIAKFPQKRPCVANIFVRKYDGGGMFMDDPGFLARWSVDAIALVRRQLFRAANGDVMLPYTSNWATDSSHPLEDNYILSEVAEEEEDKLLVTPQEPERIMNVPRWAVDVGPNRMVADTAEQQQQHQILIADLPALTEEVSELLNFMDEIMKIQRQRRLDQLRPPSWWRRNWYILATGVPCVLWLVRNGQLKFLLSSLVRTVKFFFVERIQGPLTAIFEELWKGRASFSDKKAHKESIEVLKKMIKSWLDDRYPDMPENERVRLANEMDVSLVEQKKEESMKSLGLNTLDVVRMSFIEMQWLKKEMMSALGAMDEVMSANDINMNLAAITPVVMLIYTQGRLLQYLFSLVSGYTSREETYACCRAILLDIERLLVMRDDPPNDNRQHSPPSVLGPDDLGMLMLLIHECRTILWRQSRRFSPSMIRSLSEDLAELAGERGAVSVKQQLLIVSRMTRSYPFLKVISTGHFFGNST